MSLCPVTEQPDLSSLVIEYRPDRRCIESKSLKLYLWGFRDEGAFAEVATGDGAGRIVFDKDGSVSARVVRVVSRRA
jgi:7-cyano-7-deazaguanine reductase